MRNSVGCARGWWATWPRPHRPPSGAPSRASIRTGPGAPTVARCSSPVGPTRAPCSVGADATCRFGVMTAPAPTVGGVFFPRDEELALPPGSLSPSLSRSRRVVRGGTDQAFARTAHDLQEDEGVSVAADTVRRHTQAAGRTAEVLDDAASAEIARTRPEPPDGPAQVLWEADGAMVPVVDGTWQDVTWLVVTAVVNDVPAGAPPAPRTVHASSVARLTDATTVGPAVRAELHRCGVERAGRVAGRADGAVWLREVFRLQCPALRLILDVSPATDHLAARWRAASDLATPDGPAWWEALRHTRRTVGPDPILVVARALHAADVNQADLPDHRAYLERRREQMDYPAFRAAGWPIGRGLVEGGNTWVIEDRLNGGGRRWAKPNVHPMVVLRTLRCGDRRSEGWPAIVGEQRRQRQCRRPVAPAAPPRVHPPVTARATPPPDAVLPPSAPPRLPPPAAPVVAACLRCPPGQHKPWRHLPVGHGRLTASYPDVRAKS